MHRPEIEIKQRFLLVALVLVLLAQAKNLFQHFDIKTLSFGLREDFLLALVQRLELFVDELCTKEGDDGVSEAAYWGW